MIQCDTVDKMWKTMGYIKRGSSVASASHRLFFDELETAVRGTSSVSPLAIY